MATPGDMNESNGKRKRHRLKKTEVYQPNYMVLEEIVPEGLLSKARAMVETNQRGYKATLRHLKSLEFHTGMKKEHSQLVKYHDTHNTGLIHKLGINVGDITPALSGAEAIKAFLEGLDDAVLDSIAMSKKVSVDLTRDEMIDQLLKVWNHPTEEMATV